jgi:hypothetical protein
VVGEGKAAVVDGGWLTAGPAGTGTCTASPTAVVRRGLPSSRARVICVATSDPTDSICSAPTET